MASGRNIAVYIAKESSFGTAPASANSIIKVTGISADLKQETKKSNSRVGVRFSPGQYIVGQLGSITLDSEIYPDTVGYLFKGIANKESVGSSGKGYKHTFTPKDDGDPVTFTIQEDLAGLIRYNYLGCAFDELTIDAKVKDFAAATITGSFQDKEEPDIYGYYTGTYSTLSLFTPQMISISLGGSPTNYVKNMQIKISNGLYKEDFRLNKSNLVSSLPLGAGTVTGNIEFTTDMFSEISKYDSGTSTSMVITLESSELIAAGEPYKIVITIPYIFYSAATINRDENFMTIKLDFEAFYNGTNDIYTIELYDKKSTEY